MVNPYKQPAIDNFKHLLQQAGPNRNRLLEDFCYTHQLSPKKVRQYLQGNVNSPRILTALTGLARPHYIISQVVTILKDSPQLIILIDGDNLKKGWSFFELLPFGQLVVCYNPKSDCEKFIGLPAYFVPTLNDCPEAADVALVMLATSLAITHQRQVILLTADMFKEELAAQSNIKHYSSVRHFLQAQNQTAKQSGRLLASNQTIRDGQGAIFNDNQTAKQSGRLLASNLTISDGQGAIFNDNQTAEKSNKERLTDLPNSELVKQFKANWPDSLTKFTRKMGIDGSNFSKWLRGKKQDNRSRQAVITFLAEL